MSGRFFLRQDLTIVDVSHRGHEVRVHTKTAMGRPARIDFAFSDEQALGDHLTALRRWMLLGTPVTYVRGEAEGALIDDRAVLEAALGDVDYR